MMRFSQFAWIGLGSLLALPTFSQDARKTAGAGLEGAIADTVGVLQELGGLQQSIDKGEKTSLGRLLELTEPPILDAPARDRVLAELRVAVSALQMEVDQGRSGSPTASPWENGRSPGTAPLNMLALGRLPPASLPGTEIVDASMDPARSVATVEPGPGTAQGPRTSPRTADGAVRSLEPEGYSADLLRQARLSILADRSAEALGLLDRASPSTQTTYWRARAFEALGESERAIEAYRLVTADSKEPALAARATQDLAFLEWKRDFEARRAGKAPR